MRKDTIPRFIIWLVITLAEIAVCVVLVIQDGRLGFAFLLPVISFFFLPEVFKER